MVPYKRASTFQRLAQQIGSIAEVIAETFVFQFPCFNLLDGPVFWLSYKTIHVAPEKE
jgi:hypothetical protein